MTAQPGPAPGPFDRLLLWLSPDRDAAIQKYLAIEKKLIKYFVRKGCSDPEDLFAETRERVIRIINEGRVYDNADALFYAVGRRVWHEDDREIKTQPLAFDVPAPSRSTPHLELQSACLQKCLAALSETDRNLITRYYEGERRNKIDIRSKLADENGGHNLLRIKMFRIRKKLRACIDRCMAQYGAN